MYTKVQRLLVVMTYLVLTTVIVLGECVALQKSCQILLTTIKLRTSGGTRDRSISTRLASISFEVNFDRTASKLRCLFYIFSTQQVQRQLFVPQQRRSVISDLPSVCIRRLPLSPFSRRCPLPSEPQRRLGLEREPQRAVDLGVDDGAGDPVLDGQGIAGAALGTCAAGDRR